MSSLACLPLAEIQTMDLFAVLHILSIISVISTVTSDQSTFNVLDVGAVGNGHADDTSAFIEAWNQACSSAGKSTIIIPKGKTFLVQPTNFAGNCESSQINIVLAGMIIAPKDSEAWKGKEIGRWLVFEDVNGLTISGGGVVNGRGKHWWDVSCKYHPGPGCGVTAPTSLTISRCQNVELSQIVSKRSGGVHFIIFGSQNVILKSVTIKNPERSPNTDGIHLSHSGNVAISNSNIGTGDDCISIVDRVYNVTISHVKCGPGHGISIGSLGGNGQVVHVKNIYVTHANFYRTTNGARIKTKPGGRGQVSHVVFSNLHFSAVKNPIIIDQHYGVPRGTRSEESGVRVHDVSYSGLFGTSVSKLAVSLNCSAIAPCTNIKLESIILKSASGGQPALANCRNAYGKATGKVVPRSCLRP